MLNEDIKNKGKDDEQIMKREVMGKVLERKGRNDSQLAINIDGFGDFQQGIIFSHAVLGGFEGKNIKLTVEVLEES